MTTPSFDIIVPVWNNPTETRACLVSILDSTETARLIIINNGCDRATELMLEEFCDHLGDRAIYMTMERNIGFVPALNRALARSDADWALIVRPTGTLSSLCMQKVIDATASKQAGIITPFCPSEHLPPHVLVKKNCTCLETSEISFAQLAISRVMREKIGFFDDDLDGGPLCLQDYRQRAGAGGFMVYLLPTIVVEGHTATVFGSSERRRRIEDHALAVFFKRWGIQRHFAVYLPREMEETHLCTMLELLLGAARRGHRFELLLHQRQYKMAMQHCAACLHSGIVLHKLATLTPLRSLAGTMVKLMAHDSKLEAVCGLDGIPFPGYGTALPATTLSKLGTS